LNDTNDSSLREAEQLTRHGAGRDRRSLSAAIRHSGLQQLAVSERTKTLLILEQGFLNRQAGWQAGLRSLPAAWRG